MGAANQLNALFEQLLHGHVVFGGPLSQFPTSGWR